MKPIPDNEDAEILLDCPHCGATAKALDKHNHKGVYAYLSAPASDLEPWLHVVCLECSGAAATIEAWNRRIKPFDNRRGN